MSHRHRERAVRSRVSRQPGVGELGVVCVVRADDHHLLALVPRLGHEVGVGRARGGDVRAPHDQVRGVPPVGTLGHVGLVAPDLGGRDGEVGVPVVEAQHRAADEAGVAGAHRVRRHRHRRDWREARDPVRPVLLDGVHLRGRDNLESLGPAGADKATLAPRGLIATTEVGGGRHLAEGCHGVTEPCLGLAVHLQQHPAHIRKPHPRGRVGVPAEGRTTGAASRLILRGIGPNARVVGLLRLPGDDPVLDIHLPRARAGAVHAVGRAHHLVVAPAVAVEAVTLPAAHGVQGPQIGRDVLARDQPTGAQQCLHGRSVDPARPRTRGGHVLSIGGHGADSSFVVERSTNSMTHRGVSTSTETKRAVKGAPIRSRAPRTSPRWSRHTSRSSAPARSA
ncbi:unannotated protein [freshwater metagenome]|uniref:Unannotated protein n=1 Tax=freshwater metagenome TaxID=449393 RepID=A0A6J7LAB5_9ZZZZ